MTQWDFCCILALPLDTSGLFFNNLSLINAIFATQAEKMAFAFHIFISGAVLVLEPDLKMMRLIIPSRIKHSFGRNLGILDA